MEVSEQIIQVLDAIGRKFGIIVDWSQQNILPWINELCEKLVNYELYSSIAWIGISVFMIFLMLFIVKLLIKRLPSYHDDDICVILWIVYAIMFLGFIIFICKQVFDIIACNTFPEKIILNHIQTMLKKQ